MLESHSGPDYPVSLNHRPGMITCRVSNHILEAVRKVGHMLVELKLYSCRTLIL